FAFCILHFRRESETTTKAKCKNGRHQAYNGSRERNLQHETTPVSQCKIQNAKRKMQNGRA
ncbi:MAG: hypothetical protein ACREHD_25075, partial [Pirellulales bacterium]